MDVWAERSLRLTGVCLVASALLILPAVAGIGPSAVLAVVLALLGLGALAVREQLASLPTTIGYDLGRYGQDLWLAGLLAALVVVAGPATAPAELQALGGIIGIVGMANYFLRPILLTLRSIVRRLTTRG
jgi:hypothetical protein